MRNLNLPEEGPQIEGKKPILSHITGGTRKAIVPLLLLAACVGSHMANNHVRAAAKNNTKLQEVLKVLNGLDYFNPAAIHPQTHNYWNGDPEGWDKK